MNDQLPADQFLFRWDGNFIAKPKIKTTWKIIAEVGVFSNRGKTDWKTKWYVLSQ